LVCRCSEAPSSSTKSVYKRRLHRPDDFLCGFSAAFIETCVTYPIHKTIFRQQVHGIYANQAVRQIASEGPRYLYRGLLPPLLLKTSSRSVMFGMYEQYQHLFDCEPATTPDGQFAFTRWHALAAFLSGTTEALMCPFERVQVLLQSSKYHSKFRNTGHALVELKAYGFREYYRGASSVVMRNGPSNVIFFMLRDPLRRLFEGRNLPSSQTSASAPTVYNRRRLFASMFSGGILGACISTTFYPFNVIRARQMVELGTPHLSVFKVARIIWLERDRSIRAVFRGVQLNFTRSMTTWALTNTIYDLLKFHAVIRFGKG